MKELVAINKSVIGDNEVNSVDARELHIFLESKQEFAHWVKAKVVENPFFKNGIDFCSFENVIKREKGATVRKDYALTIDTAKKVAMAEQTAKGEEVRTYFIQCEKMLNDVMQIQGVPTQLKELVDIQLMTTKYLKEMLNYSEASTLQLVHNIHKSHGIPTGYLPQYVEHQRVSFSLTDLLQKNHINMSATGLNSKLMIAGLLEEKERRSTSKGVKKFKALTPSGLKYGHNDVSPHNKNEVQPRYYEDTFLDMFNLVMNAQKAA